MAAQLLVTGTEGHHNEEETRSKPTDSRLLLLSLAVKPDSISIRQDSSRLVNDHRFCFSVQLKGGRELHVGSCWFLLDYRGKELSPTQFRWPDVHPL